ncbi:J domain-containing protein [Frankia sp. QA3]|uniref:J domain-containing protein n=1 Tax=Frankia sp. QA3 TaxID=710111 RepID=UPI0002DC0707|nr:J domain-containing protein [Frankia sp. QA3]
MTTDHNLYPVLGVDPSASGRQITRAHRTLMRRHHPDTRMPARQAAQSNHDHDAALRQVVAAYAVLRDPRRRADYEGFR